MKKNKHIILLALLFIILVTVEYMAPKPPDWRLSFSKDEKIPFGGYIIYQLLEDIFPGKNIKKNELSLFQTFSEKEFTNTSYIIVTQEFKPQLVTLEALLTFVEKGNKAFVAATNFSERFMDTLGFSTNIFYANFEKSDSLPYNFVNNYLHNDSSYYLKSGWYNFYFDSIPVNNCRSIATIENEKVNYIRLKFGKGEFFIHNQPFAFTNYNLLLDRNPEYAFKSLSYLDNETIIWDESIKPGKEATTPLSYILNQQSLKAAWFIILFLGVIFMFFSSKRMQRVIPVIAKPENSSLEFAKTLANLYLSGKNHKDIALKKYHYWLDYLRDKHYIHLEAGEIPDTEKIAIKTGVKEDLIKRIIRAQTHVKKNSDISAEQLLSFNGLIEKFHAARK